MFFFSVFLLTIVGNLIIWKFKVTYSKFSCHNKNSHTLGKFYLSRCVCVFVKRMKKKRRACFCFCVSVRSQLQKQSHENLSWVSKKFHVEFLGNGFIIFFKILVSCEVYFLFRSNFSLLNWRLRFASINTNHWFLKNKQGNE